MADAFQYQLMPNLTEEEYEALKHDIAARGVQVPIEYDEKGGILDGHHRLRACQELGIKDWPRVVRVGMTEDQKREHVLALNLARRHLSKEQRAELVARLRAEGWSLRRIANRLNVDPMTVKHDLSGVEFSTPDRIEGADGKSYPAHKPVAVFNPSPVEQGQIFDNPDVVDKLVTGEAGNVSDAIKQIRKAERQRDIEQQREAIEQGTARLPEGVFEVIVVDPPWPYGTKYDPDGRRAANPYPEMSLDEIAAIELPASEDCVLWLWTTHKFMRHSFKILDAWGFRDVAILTWVKDRMGLGSWLRSQSEFCIMAVRGNPKVTLTNQTTVIHGPLREHSRKPDEFYQLVESLCIGRRLDYFSRQHRLGWQTFGNDTAKFCESSA